MQRSSLYPYSAYTSLSLAVLNLLAVIAFHFPQYLTTPDLRALYDTDMLRFLLHITIVTSLTLGIVGLFSVKTGKALIALGINIVVLLLGGSEVAVETPISKPKFFLSMDWLLLDILMLSTVFVTLEKIFRRVPQRVFRMQWKVDLAHYFVSHIFMGSLVLIISLPGLVLSQKLDFLSLQSFLARQPIALQVFELILVTDFIQYWVHRAFHESDFLWRFHKVHHSSISLDWLSGSRLHLVDIILTRSISFIPSAMLGFNEKAIPIALGIIALQSVFIHANIRFRMKPLQPYLATPIFHHWHHSSEKNAIDKNYAVSFSFLDRIFGTYFCPANAWPKEYGLDREKIEGGYWAHLIAPFKKSSIR